MKDMKQVEKNLMALINMRADLPEETPVLILNDLTTELNEQKRLFNAYIRNENMDLMLENLAGYEIRNIDPLELITLVHSEKRLLRTEKNNAEIEERNRQKILNNLDENLELLEEIEEVFDLTPPGNLVGGQKKQKSVPA